MRDRREQNPHMHLFEAMLAWFEATGREMFLARAAELHGMMAARFFQHRTGILAEYFDGAWNPREGIDGPHLRARPSFRMVVAASPLREALGTARIRRSRRRSSRSATGTATIAQGFVVDEFLDDGRVHKASRRSWPHTEAIKAEAAAAETGDAEARAARGADDRPAAFAAFLGRPVAGRLDRPCRRERRAARRFHAGEHALPRLSRSGRSRPRLGARRRKAAGRRPMSGGAIRQAVILAGGKGTRLGAITAPFRSRCCRSPAAGRSSTFSSR